MAIVSARVDLPDDMSAAEAADRLASLWDSRGPTNWTRASYKDWEHVVASGDGLVAGARSYSVYRAVSIGINSGPGCF